MFRRSQIGTGVRVADAQGQPQQGAQPAQQPHNRALPMPPAPIDRRILDTALPIVRVLIGVAFVAYSAYSTITIFASDIAPATGLRNSYGIMQDRYLFGVALAVLLFVGELVTAERYPAVYAALLVPDTIYTARGLYGALSSILAAHLDMSAGALLVCSWVVAGVVGYCVARFGESLLFGKRRR